MFTHYKNSELCQTCGACCQEAWHFTTDPEVALRYQWLSGGLVSVTQVQKGVWLISISLPCSKLVKTIDGLWSCTVYTQKRPHFCSSFPFNYLQCNQVERSFLEWIAVRCPALKELLSKS